MAWVACWTLPRSHPSQQLGEQGSVGRDLSLSSVLLSSMGSLLFFILSCFSLSVWSCFAVWDRRLLGLLFFLFLLVLMVGLALMRPSWSLSTA